MPGISVLECTVEIQACSGFRPQAHFFNMKPALYGRLIFGASAVLFGVIALRWHDPEAWQTLSQIWKLPSGLIIGEALMVLQIVGGIGIQLPRAARWASIVLCFVYLCFSLACISNIIAAPTTFDSYDSFFEQFCLLCGSIALYAATTTSKTTRLGRLARLGLGVCAISFTLAQVIYLRFTAQLVPRWIPPNQMFWAVLTTIAFALAAIAILINRQAQLALRLMTLMLALFGVLVWIPRLVAHPEAHLNWSEFALTCLITGSAWVIAELKCI